MSSNLSPQRVPLSHSSFYRHAKAKASSDMNMLANIETRICDVSVAANNTDDFKCEHLIPKFQACNDNELCFPVAETDFLLLQLNSF